MAVYRVVGVGQHGKYFDEECYKYAIDYILSHAVYAGGVNISAPENAAQEMLDHAKACGKNSGKRIRHSVLSFGPKDRVSPAEACCFAEACMEYYEQEYQMVFAVHTDNGHIHVHFVMNQVGLSGNRYRGKRSDYYGFLRWMSDVTMRPVIPVKDTELCL